MINFDEFFQGKVFSEAFLLQRKTIKKFQSITFSIKGACPLMDFPADSEVLDNNLFSVVFLAVTKLIIKDQKNLPLYAMMNQCMRSWVTACDNILDNEYKEILPIKLGYKTASVLTLLFTDRILTSFLVENNYSAVQINEISAASLSILLPSAVQEGEEEREGRKDIFPSDLLKSIHYNKTARLFSAPLALPKQLNDVYEEKYETAVKALESFGLACQILDDIADVQRDKKESRYNYLLALSAAENLDNPEYNFSEEIISADDKARELFSQFLRCLELFGLKNLVNKQQQYYEIFSGKILNK